MAQEEEILDISKSEDEKYSYKTKDEILKKVFDQIIIGNQTICIKGRRKTGKSTLVTELIIQHLMENKENQVFLLSTYGNFNSKKFYEIAESFVEKDQKKEVITSIMKRLKIIQIENENHFHEYFSCLEALIIGFGSSLSLVVIDSLSSFYHHDSYVFEKAYGKPLTRDMYLNYYVNILASLVNQCQVTILYTLPQHLVKEYLCSKDFSDSDNEEEERKIYENIKNKFERFAHDRFPILEEDEMISVTREFEETQEFSPVKVDVIQSDGTDLMEELSSMEIKNSNSSEKLCNGQDDPIKTVEELSSLEIKNSTSSEKLSSGQDDPIKTATPEELVEIVIDQKDSNESPDQEDPLKITEQEEATYQQQEMLDNESDDQFTSPNDEFDEHISGLSISSDSFSDSDSIKSGEGYKSESGTESSSTANEKISEKIIATMYRNVQADVIIKLLNISSNCYMMHVQKDTSEFDFNFDITENGIEWDEIPAEN